MLIHAIGIGAALDQSFDGFKVAGTGGLDKLIVSGLIDHL